MIIFRQLGNDRTMAPWIRGDAHVERGIDGGRLIARCDPILLSQEGAEWQDCGAGWQVAVRGALEQDQWIRVQRWLPTVAVADREGVEWRAPIILDEEGKRIFAVPYGGADWQPRPTAEQKELIELAMTVREEIFRSVRSSEGLPTEAVCAWAARFLSASYDLSPGVFAALGLDDLLAQRVCSTAAGCLPQEPAKPAAEG